jgi:hypothetical protein
MHGFTFDGRYVYGSPEFDGYLGNIVSIIDFQYPARPQEVGRWWMPGQWIAGGERPTWEGTTYRCHHPMLAGNRLYTSYWHGGFVILGIDDITKPKFISGLDWSPPFPWPTHGIAGTLSGGRPPHGVGKQSPSWAACDSLLPNEPL